MSLLVDAFLHWNYRFTCCTWVHLVVYQIFHHLTGIKLCFPVSPWALKSSPQYPIRRDAMRQAFTSIASWASNRWAAAALRYTSMCRIRIMLVASKPFSISRSRLETAPRWQFVQHFHQTRHNPCREPSSSYQCESPLCDLPGRIYDVPLPNPRRPPVKFPAGCRHEHLMGSPHSYPTYYSFRGRWGILVCFWVSAPYSMTL